MGYLTAHLDAVVGTVVVRLIGVENVGYVTHDTKGAGIILTLITKACEHLILLLKCTLRTWAGIPIPRVLNVNLA